MRGHIEEGLVQPMDCNAPVPGARVTCREECLRFIYIDDP